MLHYANIQSTALSPVWQSAAEPFVTGNNRLLGTWSKVKEALGVKQNSPAVAKTKS